MKSKFKCPTCNHTFFKAGQNVGSDLRFCVCSYCCNGIWIDIKTGKDYCGRIYSTNRYTYCKCRPPVPIILSNPVRCEKCEKMIHTDRIKSIKRRTKNDNQ